MPGVVGAAGSWRSPARLVYPEKLSWGQKQRGSIAPALALDPRIVLFHARRRARLRAN